MLIILACAFLVSALPAAAAEPVQLPVASDGSKKLPKFKPKASFGISVPHWQDLVLGIEVIIVLLLAFANVATAGFDGEVRPLLQEYCLDCHDAESEKGGVRLDAIGGFDGASQHLWTDVYQQLSKGEMPPEDKAQPTAAERKRILDWITAETAAEMNKEGREGRRLNRREFSAALRDLTGLPIDFGAGLPGDGLTDGFDTGAQGLQDAADSVSQMLEVTRRAVECLRFLEPDRERKLSIDFREHAFTDFRKWIDQRYKEGGIFTRSQSLICEEGIGLYLPTEWSGDRGDSFLAVPAPADKRAAMTMKLRVVGKRPLPGLPQPILWVKIGGEYIDYVSVSDQPRTLEYAIRMEDNLVEDGVIKIMLRSTVEMPYAVEGFENDDRSKPEDKIPGGLGTYRPKFDRKELREPEQQPVPATVVERIEIDYDHRALWGSADEDNEESARRLLDLWIERAWRRPASEAEGERFFALYRKLRTEGFSFDDALRSAFQSVLMSGAFRYLESPAASQHAFASRLSFMLLGAPPDAELRTLAGEGKLLDAKVLDAQVDRLLDDARSVDFFRPFVTQWLNLDQPITLSMSHLNQQYFRFGRHLKESMTRETIDYVRQMFGGNRPARELITSDWTMANDILAVHYGMPPVEGARLRQVAASQPRGGGVLGHAGIQSMLCWMGDNWVIYRGAWILNHILDDPLPPPPLEIPELNPSEGENRNKTSRELLAQHSADRNCAVCHRAIDPMGFAFQNFDLSGRWREVEYQQYERKELDGKIEWRGTGDTRPVDAVGQLPRGEKFSTYAECKQLMEEHYLDDIVRGVLKKLTLYGTGRQPNALDLAAIDVIMSSQRTSGYPMRDLVKALVRSPIFLDHSTPTSPEKK